MRHIKLTRGFLLAGFVFTGLAIAAYLVIHFLLSDERSEYPHIKIFQYTFDIQNTGSQLLNNVEFSVYSPVQKTATQTVLTLNTSHPYELISDKYGNQILRFVFEHIAPYETRVVRIKTELGFSDASNKLQADDLSRFLVSEKYIETHEPMLIDAASRLGQDDPVKTARKIYEWVSSYLEYKDYIEEDRGALYALKSRQGDCTESMYLFIALARINGIPARAVGGYVYPENANFKARDYHNWAEVHINGRWRIVDPQKKAFFENQSSYVAMRLITEESIALLGNSHRFAYSGPGIVVSMH